MTITYGLLALAILAVWIPPVSLKGGIRIPLWGVAFLGAVVSAIAFGYVSAPGAAILSLLTLIAQLATSERVGRSVRTTMTVLFGVGVLALAMHKLPGFHNPILIANHQFSPDADRFTQYANFDKGAAGLLLLAFFCQRCKSFADIAAAFRKTWKIILATSVIVLGTGIATSYVKPDVKWAAYAPTFLAINLFFAVVSEEAFFRGFIQDRVGRAVSHFRYGVALVLLISGTLFAVAHLSGGISLVFLTLLAGIGHAYAYHVAQRIEVAIVGHFLLNTLHFVGFTYPSLL